MLSSNTTNPVRPIGTAVTLNCTVHVELSPAVDVPVAVNTVLTGPAGFVATSTSQPVTENTRSIIYTSIAMVSSLGRNQSGVYRCTASLNYILNNVYLINSNAMANSTRVTTGKIDKLLQLNAILFYFFIGVYLALRNHFIANNSQVNIRSIGLSSNIPNTALQCITDKNPCCLENPRLGKWYLPNGTLVHEGTSTTVFHRNRGDNGEVYLNRPSDVRSPTGQFCCQVADATNMNQTLCVVIGKI